MSSNSSDQEKIDALRILEALRHVKETITIPVVGIALHEGKKIATVRRLFVEIKKRQRLNITTTAPTKDMDILPAHLREDYSKPSPKKARDPGPSSDSDSGGKTSLPGIPEIKPVLPAREPKSTMKKRNRESSNAGEGEAGSPLPSKKARAAKGANRQKDELEL